ncbi:MAG: glutamine-hydrolyzing GMP synthase, partial [bacterium]
ILIFDFGSQTCHLISRQLRDLGISTQIVNPEISINQVKKFNPKGLVFSGGPASVYKKGSPKISKGILDLGIPILGICYGWQLIAYQLGGKVSRTGFGEYGPATISLKPGFESEELLTRLPPKFGVWFSHGDSVTHLPKGFISIGNTVNCKNTFCTNWKRKIFGIQFHPEVEHTNFGKQLLRNFIQVCGLKTKRKRINIQKIIHEICEEVGDKKVIVGVSGGIDSTIAAVLTSKAIGTNLIPVYVESGLMRIGTASRVKKFFAETLNITPVVVQAEKLFLKKLKGITDPEEKRQIIGKLYCDLFEVEAKKVRGVDFLVQGTIYSDVIESKGTEKAAKIKSHHNVGGLSKDLKLKIIEPLRYFYKDEVLKIAKRLGLPDTLIYTQPFPGPGQAVRIMGEVTKERLKKQQQADQIVLQELEKSGWLKKIFQAFPIMTGVNSTAVKGDGSFYGEVIGLRIYNSSNIMTAEWTKLPYDLLQRISSRIVNEVPEVSRVVYDITTKPPATMEWE